MPIVSISKIQHRYGLQKNLPQLSTAELGWSLDQRKLFIGNGPVSDGAPAVGNTEILTQYSDILALSDSYQYKGDAAGYTHQTGVSMSAPTTRTLQRKLDEHVSVKDFGAVGDGVEDDTDAIERALYQLFAINSNEEVRRTLFFPAGVYKVIRTLKVPTYAKIYGEGKNSSTIKQTTDSITAIELADSKQQTDPNIGTNSATIPSFIEINDISIEHSGTLGGDVVKIVATRNCIFRRVNFKGATGAAVSAGTGKSCINIGRTNQIDPETSLVYPTTNIVFEQCDIRNNVYGLLIEGDVNGVLLNACRFYRVYQGAKIGEDSSSTDLTSIKFTNCVFNKIYQQGINVFTGTSGIVSSYNHFQNVGNQDYDDASGTPTPVITFGDDGNVSIGDIFDRASETLGNSSTYRVDGQGFDNYYLDSVNGIYYGYYKTNSGKSISLADNTLVAASSTITFDSTHEKSTMIYYTATRGSDQRQGVLRVTGANVTDEYNETANIGLEFSATDAAGTITLNFTTTSTGSAVTFKYRTERLV